MVTKTFVFVTFSWLQNQKWLQKGFDPNRYLVTKSGGAGGYFRAVHYGRVVTKRNSNLVVYLVSQHQLSNHAFPCLTHQEDASAFPTQDPVKAKPPL